MDQRRGSRAEVEVDQHQHGASPKVERSTGRPELRWTTEAELRCPTVKIKSS